MFFSILQHFLCSLAQPSIHHDFVENPQSTDFAPDCVPRRQECDPGRLGQPGADVRVHEAVLAVERGGAAEHDTGREGAGQSGSDNLLLT